MTFELTPHFTLREMTVTNTGLPNVPDEEACYAMRALCSAVLEPWRSQVGALKVTSGYRSRAVNFHPSVGGSDTSQHMLGEAADVKPLDVQIETAFQTLRAMMTHGNLPVDQLIIYVRARGLGWLHVSHTHRHQARLDVRVDLLGQPRTVPYEDYRMRVNSPLVLV